MHDSMFQGATPPSDTKSMRDYVLSGIDWALNAPLMSRFISAEGRKGLLAQYTYWQNAGDDQLKKLLDIFNK